jgi:voltage-gated potassium channel
VREDISKHRPEVSTHEQQCSLMRTAASYMTPRLERWRDRTDTPLLILAIGSVPLLLLDLKRQQLSSNDRRFLDVTNLIILIAFTADYIVEFVLARKRAEFVKREWSSALIVIAQVIALLPSLVGFGALRVLRVGRAWRGLVVILRVFAIGAAGAREGRTILRRHAAQFALGLGALTWVTSAVGFTLAEDVGSGRRIRSFGDALWWSTTTITTVGYGDVYPVTAIGRVIGGLTMIVGVSTFAVLTAKFAELLVRPDRTLETTPVARVETTTQQSSAHETSAHETTAHETTAHDS